MKIKTLFTEEYESQNQDKNGFHVAEDLEWHRGESANAYELAEIGTNRNCAR